ILVIGLFVDTIISFKMMNTFKNLCKNIEQKQIIPRDDTERIKKLVKKQIQTSKMRLEKRIMDAFPHLKIQTWNKTKKKKTKKKVVNTKTTFFDKDKNNNKTKKRHFLIRNQPKYHWHNELLDIPGSNKPKELKDQERYFQVF